MHYAALEVELPSPDSPFAAARRIDAETAERLRKELGVGAGCDLAVLLGTAYPALRPSLGWQLDALNDLAATGWRTHSGRDRLHRRLRRSVGDLADRARVMSVLRRQVWAEKARIALREVLPNGLGGADLSVTALELSNVAEAALEVAVAEATDRAERRYGKPVRADGERSRLAVFGMGKLGGRELNAGSDIDIVAFYDTDEGGLEEVSLHEYWAYVVRRVVETIESATEDGIVWRVDLRLRPEGSSGPLVYSWAAAERYYETWGRLWERAALLRARAIAGDRRFGDLFTYEVITPFVYRRNVDPSIATHLAELVQRSRKELSQDPAQDLKLGPGGIREAEFFIQALQLIWGGREPGLRSPSFFSALERLFGRGLVSDREARLIAESYVLLRRVEHAVQWSTGIQTHLVPQGLGERERLARVLAIDGAPALAQSLARARQVVDELFASILPESPRPPARHAKLLARLSEPGEGLAEAAAEVFGDAEVADHLATLARQPDGLLGGRTDERFPELGDQLVEALAECSDPEQAARYLRSFYGRLLTPASYVAPLGHDPRRLARFVTVLGASAFVAEAIIARPDLADGLLFADPEVSVREARQVVASEVEACRECLEPGLAPHERREAFTGALRRAKGKVTVDVAVADLAGELDAREVTRVLSELADSILQRAVEFEMEGDPAGLAVIAVGKLGAMDIGYGSDLDVLFIYDPSAAPEGTDPGEFFGKRAQRIIRLISDQHPSGRGYELDTRLRPSGSQGLLVTSLESFARYHRVRLEGMPARSDHPTVLSSGAAWERQALLRARPCAGDRRLGAQVARVCHVAAYERGAPPAEEVHRLRLRMERELARERPGRYDIKMGRGGLLDVEFAVQWLQMRYGADPRVRTPDTLEALRMLAAAGHVRPQLFEVFREGYSFLRRLEQRIRVLHGSGTPTIDERAPGLEQLARRMGIRRGPQATEAERLIERYRLVTESIRRAYHELMGTSDD